MTASVDETPPLLVSPSAIPWADLKQEALEELLYWLLDELGLKNLTWRRGGSFTTTADGGRDLEATHYVQTPAGELQPERWWIEAKGRGRTVEKEAVQEAVHNAAGISSVDVLVFATNTQFSNPTIDWVEQWQRSHPRPKIFLWQREYLERLASKNPTVVARLFSAALSPQGRLELSRARFWQQSMYASLDDLALFWRRRSALRWSPESVLAIVASELANGDLELHPWIEVMPEPSLPTILTTAIANAGPLWERAESYGNRIEPLIDGIGYIILVSLLKLRAAETIDCIRSVWKQSNIDNFTLEQIEHEVVPQIINQVRDYLCDACARNCERVDIDLKQLSEERAAGFWRRFVFDPEYKNKGDEKMFLISEAIDAPCRAGLPLNRRRHCPLTQYRSNLDEDLNFFVYVLDDIVRQGKARPA